VENTTKINATRIKTVNVTIFQQLQKKTHTYIYITAEKTRNENNELNYRINGQNRSEARRF